MPPVQAESLDFREKKILLGWLNEELEGSEIIEEWQQKMLHPEYGNYADHTSLFDGSITEFAWSPSRLWKKNPESRR